MLSERSQMQQGAYCMFHLHEDQEQTKPIYGGKKNEKPPPPPWGHRARNWLERGIRELFEGFGLHRCMYLSNLSKWTFKIYAFHCILKVFPLQPTDWAAPRITLMVLESSLAKNQCHICQTMLTVLSKVIFPWCLMFFCFFLSLHGSLRAVMFRPVCSEWPVPLSSSDPSGPQLP